MNVSLAESNMIEAPIYRFCPMCSTALGNSVGLDGVSRQACSTCGWVYYPHAATSVAGVLIMDGRALLVCRRHAPFPGTWMFPSGFKEYAEHPEEAVKREFLEETNLTVAVQSLLSIGISTDDEREPGHLVMFYRVSYLTGEIQNETAENLDIGWFDLDRLPQIELEHHRRILRAMVVGAGS